MSRNGKIACLPLAIRTEVNRRLDDGQGGIALLEWLNGLPEVQSVVAKKFGAEPVSKHNLHRWRSGGYRAWQTRNELLSEARQEAASESRDMAEHAGGLEEVSRGRLTDHLSQVLAARYASLMLHWDGEVTDEFRRHVRTLGELSQDIGTLRKGDHDVAWRELERARRGRGRGEDGGLRMEDGGQIAEKGEHRTLNAERRMPNPHPGPLPSDPTFAQGYGGASGRGSPIGRWPAEPALSPIGPSLPQEGVKSRSQSHLVAASRTKK
jgi:hypothetical protein